MTQFADYKGSIHVHSRYSDGTSKLPEIIKDAEEAGLDYFVLSDHDTLKARVDGWEGWQGNVLVVVGVEISPRVGHTLAMRIDDCAGLKEFSPPDCLKVVREKGGLGFVVHPEGRRKRIFRINVSHWRDWDSPDFVGMEVWPYMHDWVESLTPWSFWSHYFKPHTKINGPSRDVLAKWDELCQTRRVVGIGATDNHGRGVPFRNGTFGIARILPHHYVFKTVRTHILAQPFTGDSASDLDKLYECFTEGRCYSAYDLLADSTGFRFQAIIGDATHEMGEALPFPSSPVQLVAASPHPCTLRLVANGEPAAEAEGTTLRHQASSPGVYRIEAHLEGEPWVFTNPIYLRGESP